MLDKIVLGKVARYYLDGREVTEGEYRRRYPLPSPGSSRPTGNANGNAWPIYSDALAVHPEQVAEATDSARARGVPTDFLPDGRPQFRDRAHRRQYMKAYGCHDRDGGYGDG